MKYEWESKISQATMRKIDALLPDGIHLVGVAVYVSPQIEGALILSDDFVEDGVARADILKDVMGDSEANYDDAVSGMHKQPAGRVVN